MPTAIIDISLGKWQHWKYGVIIITHFFSFGSHSLESSAECLSVRIQHFFAPSYGEIKR